jgi:hypothetical protein
MAEQKHYLKKKLSIFLTLHNNGEVLKNNRVGSWLEVQYDRSKKRKPYKRPCCMVAQSLHGRRRRLHGLPSSPPSGQYTLTQ